MSLKTRQSAGLWTLMLTAAVLVLTTGGQIARAQSDQHLSKTELRELVANAKTRADHEKIAQHYRSESERLMEEAKEHEAMAQVYAKQPGPEAQKNPLAYRTEAHCKYVAGRYREAAKKLQELAAAHEDMAKKAAK